MKLKDWIKSYWNLFPLAFMINLLAKCFIAVAVLSYLDSIGKNSFIITLIINLWILIPIYYSFISTYYDLMGCQTPHTLLINRLIRSIYRLQKASINRINATKQRMWVEHNPEINIYNYWFLKYFRRKEWENIDIKTDAISIKPKGDKF